MMHDGTRKRSLFPDYIDVMKFSLSMNDAYNAYMLTSVPFLSTLDLLAGAVACCSCLMLSPGTGTSARHSGLDEPDEELDRCRNLQPPKWLKVWFSDPWSQRHDHRHPDRGIEDRVDREGGGLLSLGAAF